MRPVGELFKRFKERFERRSLLFIISMILGLNMFIFVSLFTIDRFLAGHLTFAATVVAMIFFGFIVPYVVLTVKRSGKKLEEQKKDDIFLLLFSVSFTVIGVIILVGVFVTTIR